MSFGSHTQEEFNKALQSFFKGCQRIAEEHRQRSYPNVPAERGWRMGWGKVRVRIVKRGSAHCFVDFATGDVLKSAGWNAPAKHARGNIYDAHNGLGSMGPYGPAYLR